MTDNEIIKALERCPQHTECCYCNSLEECGNKRILTTSVFDLINRQKAENDSLKADLAKCSIRLDNLYKTADEIKSEAIKEFAEKLKEEIRCEDDCGYHCYGCGYECKDYVIAVDNLVKEMTEVQ